MHGPQATPTAGVRVMLDNTAAELIMPRQSWRGCSLPKAELQCHKLNIRNKEAELASLHGSQLKQRHTHIQVEGQGCAKSW